MPADANTLYCTGSTTKAFVAAAAAMLVHDEVKYSNFHWNSPVADFLSDQLALENDYATRHLTVEDALSHRSGLPGHDHIFGAWGDTISSTVRRLRYLPMTFEPRTAFQYCNLMYVLMSELLENVTGLKLEDLMRNKIWRPLGMMSTSMNTLSNNASQFGDRLARGYYCHSIGKDRSHSQNGHCLPEPYLDLAVVSGAGAIISSVTDYALWLRAILQSADPAGIANISSPLTADMVRDLFTPRTIPVTKGKSAAQPLVALGWVTATFLGQRLVGHNGGLPGFGTEIHMLLDSKFGVVAMGNTALTSNAAGRAVTARLLAAKLAHSSSTYGVGSLDGHVEEVLQSISTPDYLPASTSAAPASQAVAQSHSGIVQPSLDLSIFNGRYMHPAYGIINVTHAATSLLPTCHGDMLEIFLFPRTLPQKLHLAPVQGTVFAVFTFEPHGLADVTSPAPAEDLVWELVSADERAIFEYGLSGKTIDSLGIQLEPAMIENARKKGNSHWREGMIWFMRT